LITPRSGFFTSGGTSDAPPAGSASVRRWAMASASARDTSPMIETTAPFAP
jgi:hypothetical protein